MGTDADRARELRLRRASRAAVAVAGALALGKATAGLAVNSMAVLASSVDSLLDLLASTVNLVAIGIALQPPDHNHGFGHAKAESLATALQSLLIGGSAIYLLVEGTRRILVPEAMRRPVVGIAAMAVSAVASAVLVVYMRKVAREVGSSAIRADSTHYATDVLANLAVLGGVAAAAWTGARRLDGILTIGVALYVGASALSLLREATRVLMDEELPAERRRAVEGALKALVEAGSIRDWHGLRTRSSGRGSFVEVHLEMDGDLLLEEAHARGDRAMDEIKKALPRSQVLVHLDVERDEPET